MNQLITVDIGWYRIDKALGQILRDHSFVYVETGSSMLWILPQDGDENIDVNNAYLDLQSNVNQKHPFDSGLTIHLQTISPDPEEREDALTNLGEKDRQYAVEHLSIAITDTHHGVREAAIISLSEMGGTEAIEILGMALGDHDPRIREEAVDALGEVGGAVYGVDHQVWATLT